MNVLPQMTRIEYTFCFCCIFVFFYHHCLSSLALLFYHLFIRFYAFIHFVQFESILLHSLGIVFNGVVVFFFASSSSSQFVAIESIRSPLILSSSTTLATWMLRLLLLLSFVSAEINFKLISIHFACMCFAVALSLHLKSQHKLPNWELWS